MSLAEIGLVLECSSDAVKALLYRARRKLGNAITDRTDFSEVGYARLAAEPVLHRFSDHKSHP
jgi:hypothetical protein